MTEPSLDLEAAREAVLAAREHVLIAALKVLQSERAEPSATSDADASYADDLLKESAAELTKAVAAAATVVEGP